MTGCIRTSERSCANRTGKARSGVLEKRMAATTTNDTREWRGYGPHNAGQVRAERMHADGLLRSARSAKERGRAWIATDCVATARALRRWARALSHGGA